MTRQSVLRCCFVLPFTFFLSGCNNEPSAQDMRAAVLDLPEVQIGFNMMGFSPDDFRVEKISCTKAIGAPGYQCDFRVNSPLSPRTMHSGSARFVKSNFGWIVINEQQ